MGEKQMKRYDAAGDEVMIYHDPITQQDPELKGRLVRWVERTESFTYWIVDFGDGVEHTRKIFNYPAEKPTEEEGEK